ncbi:MAG: flavin reductase family protein [Gemmatimonadota bacterium]|nr:flavin reductase family protein [Gemmatimonadota bacterium]
MSATDLPEGVTSIDPDKGLWGRVYRVAPLVIVGTREADGYDLAPKHLAGPLSWEGHFGFVCADRHATYHNAKANGGFTVSFPRPDQIVLASLAAAPREGWEGGKPVLEGLPVFPGTVIDAPLVIDCDLYLECELDRIIDGFGVNSLIAGRVVAAHAHEAALITSDEDPEARLRVNPLLAYIEPGRFAAVGDTQVFPFPEGFRR